MFAADALRLAAALPAAGQAVNLCTGRYAFAVGFAAALLRGQPSLLTSDRSPAAAARPWPTRFPGARRADGRGGQPAAPCHRRAAAGRRSARSPRVPADHAGGAWCSPPAAPGSRPPTPSTGARLPPQPGCRPGLRAAPVRSARHHRGHRAAAAHVRVRATVLLPLHAACAAWCGPRLLPGRHPRRATVQAVAGPAAAGHHAAATAHCCWRPGPTCRALHGGDLRHRAARPGDGGGGRSGAGRPPVHEIFGATEVGSIASRRTRGRARSGRRMPRS